MITLFNQYLRRAFAAIALTALVTVVGCARPSINPRLAGTYTATNSEALSILADAGVYHSRVVNGREERELIGYAAATGGTAGSYSIIAPDTSPFVGTSFQVTDEFRTINVRWRDLRTQQDTNRQAQFVRKTDG